MSLATITRRSDNIRKALDAVLIIAPDTATPVTAITTGTSSDLVDFATTYPDYISLGRHTKDDGLSWSRDMETSDVMSHGQVEPVRRDITSDVMSFQVSLQETKKKTLELANNVDLTAVTTDADSGELSFSRATTPQTRYYRILALAQDGFGADRVYFARFLPRAMVSEVSEQVWSDTDELRYAITFVATVDDDLGYAVRELWGGPWWKANLANMGFGSVPDAPTSLAAGTPTATTVPLTWTASTGATSYLVEQSPASANTWTAVTAGNGGTPTTNSTTVAGLTASTAYDFRVKAVNAVGTSAPSNVATATTTA